MSRQSERRYLLPVTHCGPRDEFDPATSHRANHTDVWDGGYASRESHYVDPAARGIALAAERHKGREPVTSGWAERS
jgi:hypothetical protein